MELKNKNGLTEKEFLKLYNPGDYPKPSVTVDNVILGLNKDSNSKIKGLKVLLIKRKDHPFINKWALPGGFVNIDEDIDDAAKRELLEETHVENIYLEQLKTYGNPERDPRMRVISVAYLALINCNEINPIAGDDADEAEWFDINLHKRDDGREDLIILKDEELLDSFVFENEKCVSTYSEMLAFDHMIILYDAMNRIRNKIEYTDIALNLLPEKFTIPELQNIYETILNKKIYKTNFRKKMNDFIEKTNESRKNGAHRPSQLYKRKEKNYYVRK